MSKVNSNFFNEQDFGTWFQQNPNGTYLQYLKEQLARVSFYLQPYFANFLFKETIDDLKNQEEYFSAKIHKVKWAIKTREIIRNDDINHYENH